ncbi:parallel beta helix pectate lyase-like protein [Anseongella ginsenosidimutans]|uniref:Parallel beta helix pectate lyase-like protein n=1 Tax=Anseongella ginsenosidimutans TaxID=496056 RepID=A0A4R3KPD4_9SPHI|nr:right-handed parallel beta-helix repeat-containing protein [Anseongella ginsenosidimutans]QEC52583.1 right-handed parallel beta-helix repeat-containing protein [Anseongella ginsenosidimutans]TCS86500.1 parallel beta helix pectate lyase-like protein [Anseongella ginsenosidimutans]
MANQIRGTFFLFLLALACTPRVHSQQLHVAATGSDGNAGTSAQPLATVEAALERIRLMRKQNKLSGPLEIIIAPGTYFLKKPLELTGEDSGTGEFPLIIKGAGAANGAVPAKGAGTAKDAEAEKPVLSGGVELPPFEEVSEKLWKIQLPAIERFGGNIGQLFVNGQRAIRARSPDAGRLFKTRSAGEIIIDTDRRSPSVAIQKIDLTEEQAGVLKGLPPSDLQQVIISVQHAWDRTRKYLQSFDAENASVYIAGRPMHPWNTLENSSQFYFENAKAFLDAPGEWYLDPSGTLYYVPRQGETIENSKAVTPVLDQLLLIRGTEKRKASHIQFENISFKFSRYLMDFRGNEPAQAAAPTGAAVMLDYAENIEFRNCGIAHTGNNAIWFRTACSNSAIRRSYLHDLGIGGIKIGPLHQPSGSEDGKELVTKHITVDNNIIRSGGHEFPTGVGVIIFNASDNTISHNEIADFRYSGVSVGWVWGYSHSVSKRNKIVYNHIHHLGWGELSDMGGVYTLGPSEGTVVSNNVIHHIYSYGYGGWGLYTDEGSTGILMENNLVYRCKSSGFHQHYGKDNMIRNNIFASQVKAQLEATRVEDHRSFTFNNNIVYFDSGILIGKPGWVNARFEADNNCYWDTRSQDIRFGNCSFSEWQDSTGKDRHSIIANPGFKDAAGYDFRFKNKKNISKIGFKPFDYSAAGVYGDKEWKKLALFDPQRAARFDQVIAEREQDD